MTTATLVTAEQLLHMEHDGHRYELVAGELKEMSPPSSRHCAVASVVDGLLGNFIRRRGLGALLVGDAGFLIARDPDTVRGADVAFVSREALAIEPLGEGYRHGAPELAIEVVSPGDSASEVEEKAQAWLDAGTAVVWVIDPAARTVTVYRPGAHPHVLTVRDRLSAPDLLPGFRCRIADLFASL